MLQERPVEPDGWKDKLDRLDELPGEPWAGKNAAWDKLYTRLHEKPRQKAGPWWLAAAVFLLLVAGACLLILHTHETKQPLVKNNSLPVHAGSPATPPAIAPIEKTYPAATISNSASDSDDRQPAPILLTVKHEKTLPFAGQPADTSNTQQISIALPVIRADTPVLASVMALPSPKKLRVIHINELEAPAGDNVQPARLPGSRSFRFLLSPIDDGRTMSYQATETGSSPLNMKIRTQN